MKESIYEVYKMEFTEKLLTETKEVLQRDYGVDVSLKETNEILLNLTKYVTLLHEISMGIESE
jgi:hypothetical protein